jgi:hypothetical protein
MKQSDLTALQLYYHDKPVAFFTDILNAELDEQQVELVQLVQRGCRICVKSSKGTGKTFVIAGLSFWFLLCHPNCTVRVLSPSYDQLIDVFMREANMHHQRMLPAIQDLFDVKYDKITLRDDKTNVCMCISAKSTKKERQSGAHSFTQVYLFDEASGIPDETWSNAIGSLGTAAGKGYVIAVSNPERGSEPFYQNLFVKKPAGWELLTFTAFRSKQTTQEFIEEIRELYGEDSDEWRVMILGEFPLSDGSMYIPMSLVDSAIERIVANEAWFPYPAVIGADIARSKSGDKTVFICRKGYKVTDIISFQTDDTMETVARLQELYKNTQAIVIYMDADGVGGPVADRCRQLGMPVVDVRGSLPSVDPRQYANTRTQLWGEMREWLAHGQIPMHHELREELGNMRWGHNGNMAEQLAVKRKLTDAQGRRLHSPDFADALALTFFQTVVTVARRTTRARPVRRARWI